MRRKRNGGKEDKLQAQRRPPPVDLGKLSGLLALAKSLCHTTCEHTKREEILATIIEKLPSLAPQDKLQAMDVLHRIIECSPSWFTHMPVALERMVAVLTHSVNSEHLPDEVAASLHAKIVWIVGRLGRTSMTVKALRGMLALIQSVIEGHVRPELARLILATFRDMAKLPSGSGVAYPPHMAFSFSGKVSYLRPPPLDKWSGSAGFTFCVWIKWHEDEPPDFAEILRGGGSSETTLADSSAAAGRIHRRIASGHTNHEGGGQDARRAIVSVWSDGHSGSANNGGGVGCEASICRSTGRLFYEVCYSASQSELHPILSLPASRKGGGADAPDTKESPSPHQQQHLRLGAHRWHFLCISHHRTMATGRKGASSGGRIQVWVDGALEADQPLAFPAPLAYKTGQVQSAIGSRASGWGENKTSASSSPPSAAAGKPARGVLCFQGQIASAYLVQRPLTPEQVVVLFRNGPDLQPSSRLYKPPKKSMLSSFFRRIASSSSARAEEEAMSRRRALENLEFLDEREGGLRFFYSSKCVGQTSNMSCQLATDLSPLATFESSLDALISPAVRVVRYGSFSCALHSCPGGIMQLMNIIKNLKCLQRPTAHHGMSSAISVQQQQEEEEEEDGRGGGYAEERKDHSLLPCVLWILAGVLSESPLHRWEALKISLFAMMGCLLRRLEPSLVTAEILAPLKSVMAVLSWHHHEKVAQHDDDDEGGEKMLVVVKNYELRRSIAFEAAGRGRTLSGSSARSNSISGGSSSSNKQQDQNHNHHHHLHHHYYSDPHHHFGVMTNMNSSVRTRPRLRRGSSSISSSSSSSSSSSRGRRRSKANATSPRNAPHHVTEGDGHYHYYHFYDFVQNQYDGVSTSIPLSLAAERTLFNEFVHEILLNFECWVRVDRWRLQRRMERRRRRSRMDRKLPPSSSSSSSPSVGGVAVKGGGARSSSDDERSIMKSVVGLLFTLASKQPSYYRILVPVPHLLGLMKMNLGYAYRKGGGGSCPPAQKK